MKQQRALLFVLLACLLMCLNGVASDVDVKLTHDGPVILGGTITFKAELIDSDGHPPSGTFEYTWEDDALQKHFYKTETTPNTTTYYSVSYPSSDYHVGVYTMQVAVCKWSKWVLNLICVDYTSQRVKFHVTRLLNGNLAIQQYNKTVTSKFVSSSEVAKLSVDLHKGDYDYIKSASNVTTYWFVDCQQVNITSDFKFNYIFNRSDTFHEIQALVKASFDPPPTTVAPTTTTTTSTTPKPSNSSTPLKFTNNTLTTTTTTTTTTSTPKPLSTTTISNGGKKNNTVPLMGNMTHPFVCNSQIPPEPNVTYGFFYREVQVRTPISNLKIEGSTWIQPWEMLSLKISCNGSGPFHKCIKIHSGQYNVTNNETCNQDTEIIDRCEFTFYHYFLDPHESTVLIILSNEVSTEIHPVAVNIYKLIPQPQLSVIVVPISCILIAVVLIVFGIAYYVQSTSRYTVEVADFDFTQNSADMEYKTFTERLRDSFNNAGYKQLNNQREVQ